MEQREFIVEAEGAGQRIDRFLSGEDTGLSRSALQALVADGHVLCNGKAPVKSLKLKAGDIILLEIPDARPIEAVPQEIPLSTAVWQMGRIAGMTRGLETGDLDLIAAANDDRIQEPYRRRLIPDYNAVRDTCLNGGAKTIWISGSGSTLMAVTDDTIVAKFLQVKLREQFPKCETHILTCDTEGAQIEYL